MENTTIVVVDAPDRDLAIPRQYHVINPHRRRVRRWVDAIYHRLSAQGSGEMEVAERGKEWKWKVSSWVNRHPVSKVRQDRHGNTASKEENENYCANSISR